MREYVLKRYILYETLSKRLDLFIGHGKRAIVN